MLPVSLHPVTSSTCSLYSERDRPSVQARIWAETSAVRQYLTTYVFLRMEVTKTSSYANGDSKSEDKQSDAESTTSQNVCGSCLSRLRRLIPTGFKDEVVQLLKLTGPVVRFCNRTITTLRFTDCMHTSVLTSDFSLEMNIQSSIFIDVIAYCMQD